MSDVAEIHGIFQCLEVADKFDTSSARTDHEDYCPVTADAGWFLVKENLYKEAKEMKSVRWTLEQDFTVAKLQIDLLYYQKQFDKAYAKAKASYQYHKIKNDLRREIVDTVARCALRVSPTPKVLLAELAFWFDTKQHSKDTGLCWLRACIAEGLENWADAISACDSYLAIRPGELCVYEKKRGYLKNLLQMDRDSLDLQAALADIDNNIRIIEYNFARG